VTPAWRACTKPSTPTPAGCRRLDHAVGLFYYSGHGAADAGTNYLIPVDVTTTETGELWGQSLRLTEITRKLKTEAGNATHFVVFDACRNTLKLTNVGSRAMVQSKGFVPVAQVSGMLIAYATAEGELASDVGVGAGPYAKTLAEEIIKPGVEAVAMFRVVQRRVRMAIKQEPYLGFNAMGDVYLAGTASAQATARLSEAAEAWDRTKDTTSISALEAFIGRFGDSYYGDLAKVRLAELKLAAEAAARKKADEVARAKAEAERQRLALLQREEEAKKRAEAEEARRKAEIQTERNDCTSNDSERKIRGCTALISRGQSNAITFYDRGSAYANKGDLAIELDPKYVHAYNSRGLAYADNKKDYDHAFADFNKAIELDPKYVLAYNNRGLAYADNKKDYDRAIADYDKAIELDPKYVHAYNNRGRVYAYNKKDYDRAITDYNRAIELDPKYVLAYNNRGRAYADKRDYDRAIADYDKAIELDPKYTNAYNNRGMAYENKKDTNRAIAVYRKALALDPNNGFASDGLKRLGAKP
jgi:tetratricopeptide (TPR) repeat protein